MPQQVISGVIAAVLGAVVDYMIEGQIYSAVKAAFIFGFGVFVIARSLASKKQN